MAGSFGEIGEGGGRAFCDADGAVEEVGCGEVGEAGGAGGLEVGAVGAGGVAVLAYSVDWQGVGGACIVAAFVVEILGGVARCAVGCCGGAGLTAGAFVGDVGDVDVAVGGGGEAGEVGGVVDVGVDTAG